jgi:hypothetical protein
MGESRVRFRPHLMQLIRIVAGTALGISLAACTHSFEARANKANTVSYCGFRLFSNTLNVAALNRVLASVSYAGFKGNATPDGVLRDSLQQYGGALVTWHDLDIRVPGTPTAILDKQARLESAAVLDHSNGFYQLVLLKFGDRQS